MKPVSPVVDKEITNTLIQQEAACIVIDDDQIIFILNSNANKIECEILKIVTFKRQNFLTGEINTQRNFNR